MPTSSQKKNPITVRMVLEDRQAINELLKHKRAEFESVIKRGVVAMLNAHDERRKIAKERAKYFDFITRRNKKNKERFSAIAEAAKNTTSSAPMGIGTATNVVFSAASVAGVAAYNNAEERRQEREAEKELQTAQLLHYISSKNYEDIAQRVAKILSYRFQFLLFRLAAGEDGYFKLANFFLESMNTYAIERLREHKGEEVKALIDAAIPPSTDAFTYRDWPQVDVRNLKATFIIGKRKTLALDKNADALLERCGPAVRAFLGGYKEHVEYATSKIIPYKPYTILGALNHAPILGDDGRVISGLKDKNRQYEGVSGTRKYPMILLSCGENTSDLGVTFGTTMAETLDDEHIETLRRLVPHFFSYQANYELTPLSLNKQSVELKTNDADLRYPHERTECSWTRRRERDWHKRTQSIYSAGHLASEEEEEEVVTTEHYNQFKAMQAASNTFDAEEARQAVIQMTKEARDIQLTVYATELKSEERHKKQLEAAAIAKYSALAVHDLMTCVITYGPSKDDYFILTDKILETGQSTLNATRDLPLKESRMYQYALAASQTISTHANVAFSLHLFCQRNFQLLLDVLKKSTDFNLENKFFHYEKEKQSKEIKKLRDDIKKYTGQGLYYYELAKASAITHEAPSSIDSDDYLADAPDASNEPLLSPLSTLEIQQKLRLTELTEAMMYLSDETLNAKTLIEMIDLCDIETKKNHESLRVALSHETCTVTEEASDDGLDIDDDDDEDEKDDEGRDDKFTPATKKRAVLAASEVACEQASASKLRKDELLESESFWQRHGITTGIKPELIIQKNNALEARKTSQALLKRVKLSPHEELNARSNMDVDAFFERIRTEATLARLRFEGHQVTHIQQKKPSPQSLQTQQQIQEVLTNLDEKTQDLRRSIKKINAYNAEMTYEKMKRRTDTVRKDSNLHQIAKQARKIRLHCEVLEKIITDDINLIYFLEKKAAFEVTEIEEAKESIDTLKERLAYLYERNFVPKNTVIAVEDSEKKILDDTSLSIASVTSNNTVDRVDELIKHLEENNLLENSSDNLKEILLSFMTSLEETPYLQAIKEEEIQHKILDILREIKEKITKNPDYLIDHWEIELVLKINLWLIEAVQKNEVVYRVDEFLELDEGSIAMIQSHATNLPEPTALQSTSKSDAKLDTKPDASERLEANSHLDIGKKMLFSAHLSFKPTKKALLRDKSYKERISAAENLSRVSGDSESSDSTAITASSHNTDKTLSTEITSATEALERIKKITSKKSPALKSQIEGASRSIEEAYHMVYCTKNQLLENARRDINPALDKWNLVSSTLSWAGRLTSTELRWLEKRQLSRKLSKPVQSSTRKSLIRMASSLVFAFCNDTLEKKKHALGELNKFHRPLQRIRKQLYDLDALNQQSGQKEVPAHKAARILYKKLVLLINEKMEQEEEKKDDVDALRSSVLAKTMRIHFDEWKRKMYKPEEQSERLQAIRAGREQKQLTARTSESQVATKDMSKAPTKREKKNRFLKDNQLLSEHHFYSGDAHTLEEEAANMTINDLEAMLDNLQGKIDNMMKPFKFSQPLGRSHSFYGGGAKVDDSSPMFDLNDPERTPSTLKAKIYSRDNKTFSY